MELKNAGIGKPIDVEQADRIEELESALKEIANHAKNTSPAWFKMSPVWIIADAALNGDG